MASSNIKLFDENKGNMLTDTEFNISAQRLNGLQTGVASSQLQNKAMYQVSLVAYAIAQVMMQNGLNANDTDAVSTFVANLSGTMLQKVYDIATTEEAKAGVATGKWMSPALVKAAIDKTLSDNDFLKKSGGTMTGALSAPYFNLTQQNANLSFNTGEIYDLWIHANLGNVFFHFYNKIDGKIDYGFSFVPGNILINDTNTCLHTGNAQSLGFPKIAIGSYVGTGTWGSGSPTSLTFNFEPKIVFIMANQSNGFSPGTAFIRGQSWSGGLGETSIEPGKMQNAVSWSGNTVSWYALNSYESVKAQMNVGGATYFYCALG